MLFFICRMSTMCNTTAIHIQQKNILLINFLEVLLLLNQEEKSHVYVCKAATRFVGCLLCPVCCTDKVPCTAMYVCSCIQLSCLLEFIYQTWYPSGKSKWQLFVRYSKSCTVCTNPTRRSHKSCAFWLPKVFLSAGPFRTVITGHCEFHPSAFSSRLLKAGT